MTILDGGASTMTLSYRREPPWAELRVLRGAPTRTFVFDGDLPMHHIAGSGPSATLMFAVRGVAPHHFELVWDGRNLWLEDTLRLGRTTINGKPVNEWMCVRGHALVNFGAASLAVSSDCFAPPQNVPDFAALERARLLDSGPIRKRETVRIAVPKKACGDP